MSGYQGARKWKVKLLIFLIWSLSTLVSLAPLLGCNRYSYEGYLISATVDYLSQDTADIFFNWMLFSIAWLGPSAMILYSHLKILKANRLVLFSSVVHLHVEDFSEELLRQCLLCHKEPARRIQSPLQGALERKKPPTRGFLLAPRWFFMA